VKRVAWGWYWIPESYRDAWEFLARDRGFKVAVKQTAASLWNYGFARARSMEEELSKFLCKNHFVPRKKYLPRGPEKSKHRM
jgi:hypothetical protein